MNWEKILHEYMTVVGKYEGVDFLPTDLEKHLDTQHTFGKLTVEETQALYKLGLENRTKENT